MAVVVTRTIMGDRPDRERLAARVLDLCGTLAGRRSSVVGHQSPGGDGR
jgi:hypothetical protein